ncbi:sensor histidine kinase [Cognataquiflexum aquatile]|uniref:sensor histidine kinase n=1 Tax=Cognataquiflexum aquatile TaxID=2249427 RepID=UPI000DEB63FE|nr:ATP-binding protein [Cognataquiflexum aquatile]
MKPKTGFSHPIFYLLFIPLIVAISCTNKTDTPFPENGSGYEIPKAVPFQMPEGKPIQWKTYPEDSIPKAVKITFDVEKLPSKPFTINEFKPLKNPITSTSFDWDKLESIPFKADSIDKFPVKVRKFILPNPIVTPASLPSVWTGGTSAIVRLGQAEGLLGNKVYSLLTDNFGSVWIGTERGLHKYNGSEFLTYNFFGKNENGSIEIISDLILDKEGRLVISGLVTGVYRLDITLGIVEHFAYEKGFVRMDFDHEGVLWGTNNGLFFLDMENRLISEVDLDRANSNLNVAIGVKEDSQKNIWIGFGEKIGILDPERKAIRFIGELEGLVVRTAYNFTEDKSGNVWITAFSTDAFSVSLQNSKIMHLGAAQGYFGRTTDVFEDSMDRLWLVSNDTLTVYDQASSKMKKILTGSPIRVAGFPSSSMKGNGDVIWVGTDKHGILLVDPNGMLAENFSANNGLESNDVWGIDEDSQGRIWMATYRGINIYDPAKEKLSLLKLPSELSGNDFRQLIATGEDKFFAGIIGGFAIIDVKGKSITYYNTVQKGLANAVFNGVQSSDGKFWMGTGNGLLVFDPTSNSFQKLDKSNGLISNTSFVVIKDRKGKIWVCSDAGINIIDPKTNTNVTLQKKEGLLSNYNSMVFESESGEVIVGGDEGFSIFGLDETSITHVSAKNGLMPPALYDLTEVNGKIHVGSENGIIIVNRPTPANPDQAWHFSNFGKSSGIPYNDYNQSTAFQTKKGPVFWGAAPIMTVVHQDPIIDKNPPIVEIKGMNIMDQNPIFMNTSFLKNSLSEGDTLWNSDFTIGYTKDNFPADSSYLSQNNIQWDSISPGFQMPNQLKLPYDQNSFNFSFVNQSVLGRDKIVYRYILEGADQAWSDASPKANSRIYYNLTPGDYTFKVATRGFNGIWSEPATLDFEILPPWWQTWWAYLLFASLFGGLTYGIVHVRSQYLKKENRILEEKVLHRTSQLKKSIDDLKATQSQLIQSEKMASLGELTAGIAHEIQNPLNFVNNFSELSVELADELKLELSKIDIDSGQRDELEAIANDIIQNQQKIHHHGKRADSIVKGMLQHSRASSGQKELTDINALADEYLRLSYHGLRAKDKSFNAEFKTDLDPNLPKVSVVAQDLGRVLLNLVNNAFYACGNSEFRAQNAAVKPLVTVSTSTLEDGGGVKISVKDNGPGIPDHVKEKIFQPFFTTKPTGQGTGLGLSLSYDIVKAHGGQLRLETKVGLGTEFMIILPIQNQI